MAYTVIPDSLITVGEATKKEIFQQIKDNQESFNTDIEALKQTSTLDVFNIKFSGSITQYSASEIATRVPVFKAPVGATFVSVTATLLTASTSGSLSIELDKSTDNGVNWTPLLTSPVVLSGTAVGSISGSVSWVDLASQSFDQNDLIRVRITTVQVDQGEFQFSAYSEVS